MKFQNTTSLIVSEIRRLDIPYLYCLAKKDGKDIFRYRYDKSNGNNDLLAFYSMSKPITVIALLQLVERGLVDLDDEVSQYLPNYKHLHLFDGEEISVPITIKHLLTMTSGLDYDLGRQSIKDLVNADSSASTIDLCNVFGDDGILFTPGTAFNYSLSIDAAAAIIEIVSKERFSAYIDDHIFRPLGMNDSTFRHDERLLSKTRDEYSYDSGKPMICMKAYQWFHPTNNYESGGAGLISKVEDYSKFADSLANRSNRIIKDSTVDLMDKVYVENTPFEDMETNYSKNREEYGYGFGVRVRKAESRCHIPKGEFGWDGAMGSYCLIDRENHISIVIGLAISNWPSVIPNLHLDIANAVYKDIFGNK